MVFRAIGLRGILRSSPSVKAVLLLSLVMILATVISATVVLVDLRQKELNHAEGEIISLGEILSDQTARTFDGVVLMMRGARERLSDDIGRGFKLDSDPVRLLLQARIAGLPQVKSLFLIDNQGLGVNSSRADFIRNLSMADREFFSHFVDGGSDEIFISRPEKARVDGQWAYYVSVRLLDVSGQLRGVLVASINIEYFESLYENITMEFATRILLLNHQGILLAGKPHNEAMFAKLDANPAALKELLDHPAGHVVMDSEALAGGKRYVAYHQVAKYPLVISVAVDEDDALTPWHRVARPIAASAILVVLFVLLATFLMARNLLRKSLLESSLKENDDQLRQMVQSVRDAIVTMNSARSVVLFNGAAEQMFGIQADQAIGSEIGALLSRCLHQPQLASLLSYLEEGWRSPAGMALLGSVELLRDEQPFPVELSLSTTTFRGEILLTAVFRDLTESQRAERELLETNRQLKELSASLQNVREEEQARISRELHDELGQLLTGIRMEVSWLGGRLLAEQQVLVSKVGSIKGQIDQTIASVRRISSELRPLVLDDLGFAAAASWYVDQFSARTGLPVALVLSDDDPQRGDPTATVLFRVLQESLTNVARHAGVTKVEVRFGFRDDGWTLSISDDGAGFVLDAATRGGLGLVGMRERVQILGGQFALTTAPGEGTLVEVVVPSGKIREGQ
ncbi:cache domain-containing protein [Propionivibrio sp.]|uniref:cache domain-containing protein n=1 Tax=Propionivibrio sp. TaxID=2212460 RepID=UPI003BF06DF7